MVTTVFGATGANAAGSAQSKLGRVPFRAVASALLVFCNGVVLARLAFLDADGWVLALGFVLPVLVGLWPGRAASILSTGLLVASVASFHLTPVSTPRPSARPPVLMRVTVTIGRDHGTAATLMVDGVTFRSNASGIIDIPLQSIPARLTVYLIEGARRLKFNVDTTACRVGPVLSVALDVAAENAICTPGEHVIGG
jgi:hypothetical protein